MAGVACSHRDGPGPRPIDEAVGRRRVHRGELQPRVVEPLGQLRHGERIAVVEMRPQGKDLHPAEAVRRDVDEVLAVEA